VADSPCNQRVEESVELGMAEKKRRYGRKPANIFTRKAVAEEIAAYEYKHKPVLNIYHESLSILPKEKPTPKKWAAEIEELNQILENNPVISINEQIRKSKDESEKIQEHEPQRRKIKYREEESL